MLQLQPRAVTLRSWSATSAVGNLLETLLPAFNLLFVRNWLSLVTRTKARVLRERVRRPHIVNIENNSYSCTKGLNRIRRGKKPCGVRLGRSQQLRLQRRGGGQTDADLGLRALQSPPAQALQRLPVAAAK